MNIWRSAKATINSNLFVGIIGAIAALGTFWYSHRSSDVRFHITQVGLGASGSFPDVRITIGENEVEAADIYTVDFISVGGPDQKLVSPAISFTKGQLLGGPKTVDPSPVQHISCSKEKTIIRCSLGPIQGNGEQFRVSVACSGCDSPRVYLAEPGVTLSPSELVVSIQTAIWVFAITALVGVGTAFYIVRRVIRQVESEIDKKA